MVQTSFVPAVLHFGGQPPRARRPQLVVRPARLEVRVGAPRHSPVPFAKYAVLLGFPANSVTEALYFSSRVLTRLLTLLLTVVRRIFAGLCGCPRVAIRATLRNRRTLRFSSAITGQRAAIRRFSATPRRIPMPTFHPCSTPSVTALLSARRSGLPMPTRPFDKSQRQSATTLEVDLALAVANLKSSP